MGVSGSGKTTIGRQVAERMDWPFFEGDDMHPESNVEKMRSGEPLADHDRQPWLEAIRDLAARLAEEERSGVIACSALKRAYRDLIAVKAEEAVHFVYLKGDYDQIKKRLEERDDHYMSAGMLDSQFDALEAPEADEQVIEVSIAGTPEQVVQRVVQHVTV